MNLAYPYVLPYKNSWHYQNDSSKEHCYIHYDCAFDKDLEY